MDNHLLICFIINCSTARVFVLFCCFHTNFILTTPVSAVQSYMQPCYSAIAGSLNNLTPHLFLQ
jgi:hypothetical protein